MSRRKAPEEYIKGAATHRRTEGDYMGVLLDAVTLDDWRDVVTATLELAKSGDPQARAWLAQYLVGKPEAKAPTPLTVVVQQLNGADPVVERLAKPAINRVLYPAMHRNDEWEEGVKALVASELAAKVPVQETPGHPATAGDPGESAP